MKKTKIICTLGPASYAPEVMENMLRAGMNVARVNFSHGAHETHRKAIETFRAVRDKLGMSAAVLLDTKGPEIRLGVFPAPVTLDAGASYTLTTEQTEGDGERACISFPDLPQQLSAGQRILIDDGKIIFEVERTTKTEIFCRIIQGGTLSSRKSINIPYLHVEMPYLSEQDKADLRFGVEMDVDFVAASFTRSKEDIIALRKFLDYYGGHRIRIIAKIENNEGVENFDEILQYADGIMVARGDMGVEIAFERLPGIQKSFIHKCYRAGKIVITATQMLESMITSATPTRAEITDVANAVFDGTSAVMLSGETAMGAHPALVVEVMSRIVRQAESDALSLNIYAPGQESVTDTTNAICDAACTTAKDIGAKAIITVTEMGNAARGISKFRPPQPIVAATPCLKTFHQLSMSWGVFPVLALEQNDLNCLLTHAIDCARQIDLVEKGDRVVITGGVPLGIPGSTNLIKLETVH